MSEQGAVGQGDARAAANLEVVVWLDGNLVDPRTASLHWSDHGITVGDGVFETVKLDGGRPFELDRHLTRLAASAHGLGLRPPEESRVRAAVGEVVRAWGERLGRLRITVTAGPGPMGSARGPGAPTLLVTAGPLVLDRAPTDVAVMRWTRNENGALAGLKTTSYAENVVALAAAQALGAGEAVFANTAGELCEGTGSNVFVGFGDRLVTPPLSSGCLAGVTRALLLEVLAENSFPVEEASVPISALDSVDEAFLVATTREVQPVSAVIWPDGRRRELPVCPGPLTDRCQQLWDRKLGDPASL